MDGHLSLPTEEDKLTSHFDKSAATVRDSLQWLENDVTRPLAQCIFDSFRQHPIRSTYLTILVALIFLPALSFVGTSLFVVTSCVSVALIAAFISATLVVAFFGVLFLGTLFLFIGVSVFLTALVIGGYLLIRLVLLTYDVGPRAGFVAWANESRKALLPSRFHPVESQPAGANPTMGGEGQSRGRLIADKNQNGASPGSQEAGLVGNGAVGADLGSPPTVAKWGLEKE